MEKLALKSTLEVYQEKCGETLSQKRTQIIEKAKQKGNVKEREFADWSAIISKVTKVHWKGGS